MIKISAPFPLHLLPVAGLLRLSAVQILSFYLYRAWGNIYPGPLKQGGYEWASSQLVKLAARSLPANVSVIGKAGSLTAASAWSS